MNAATSNTRESKTLLLYFTNRLDAVGRNTEWHEAYEKYAVSKKNKFNEKEIA